MKTIIVACSRQRVIGIDNSLPWRLPADLRRFKQLTMGAALIMGYNTWLSLPSVLSGRLNIVLSRQQRSLAFDPATLAANTQVVLANSLAAAYELAAEREIMIIGGAQIYQSALASAERILMTELDLQVAGDSYFPELSAHKWQRRILSEHQQAELPLANGQTQAAFNYRYVEYLPKN